jgi:tetratricopeptide (TPR) repeat protein
MRRRPLLLCVGLGLLAVVARADWWADDSRRKADRLLALGREAIAAQDWDKADDHADHLIASGHRDHGRLLRGESLFHQHRPESAFEALNKVRGDALRVDAARTQGRCLLEMGNEREADRVFRYVLQERPDDADAYRGLAAIAYDLGNWLDAERYLRKVAELAPTDGRPLWTLGLIHQDLALHALAEESFRESLARELPGDIPGQVHADLAVSLAEQKKYAEAIQELASAGLPALSPRQARIRVDCLRSLGRPEEALLQAEMFLEQVPGDSGLLAEKGLALVDLKRAKEAALVLEQALSANPHDRLAREGLRRAYQSLGRSADAAEQPRKLAESDALYAALTALTHEAMEKPWDAGVRLKLAETCDQLRKPELAAMWRKAARTAEGG